MKILKPLLWIIIIVAIVAAGLFVINSGIDWQIKKIDKLKKEISFLKSEITPIRYKVIKKNGDMLSVALKFYDLDGNQIGKTRQYELKGNTVSFDFYLAKFNDEYIAIPYKIFTDEIKPEDGISLYENYEERDFPMIYKSINSSKAFNQGIKALYEKIKSGDFQDMKNVFGNMVQNHPKADSSKIDDSTYKIIVHKKGGIEIIED